MTFHCCYGGGDNVTTNQVNLNKYKILALKHFVSLPINLSIPCKSSLPSTFNITMFSKIFENFFFLFLDFLKASESDFIRNLRFFIFSFITTTPHDVLDKKYINIITLHLHMLMLTIPFDDLKDVNKC